MIRIIVLGAAAGGGVPQWNCGCRVCTLARSDPGAWRGTQSSIAFSIDDQHWFLVNASPDLRQQIEATAQLHPRRGELRHSPIAGVVLTNSEVDAVTGLLSLREGSPFTIYAHDRVLSILKSNSIFNVLGEHTVTRAPIEIDRRSSRRCRMARPPASRSCRSRSPARAPGISRARPSRRERWRGRYAGAADHDKSSGRYFFFLAACAEVSRS